MYRNLALYGIESASKAHRFPRATFRDYKIFLRSDKRQDK